MFVWTIQLHHSLSGSVAQMLGSNGALYRGVTESLLAGNSKAKVGQLIALERPFWMAAPIVFKLVWPMGITAWYLEGSHLLLTLWALLDHPKIRQ